ncbi:MAG: N-acetyltransferase family protein [Thermoplasmata archaeon]
MKIRPASEADLLAMAEIYNDAVLHTTATFDTEPRDEERMRRWYLAHKPSHPILVAEEDGRVVGWASLSRWSRRKGYDRTVELSVYVAREHRGRGIGKALMEGILEEGKRAGFHLVVSRIVEGSDASLHLHEALGFERVGVMREAGWKFGRWLDVHIFQKLLD